MNTFVSPTATFLAFLEGAAGIAAGFDFLMMPTQITESFQTLWTGRIPQRAFSSRLSYAERGGRLRRTTGGVVGARLTRAWA